MFVAVTVDVTAVVIAISGYVNTLHNHQSQFHDVRTIKLKRAYVKIIIAFNAFKLFSQSIYIF